MKIRTFLQFVSPSVGLMLLLLAAPLLITFYLSVRTCALEMETVKVEESSPFGKRETVTQRAKTDASGRGIEKCAFVGLDYYRKVLGLDEDDVPAAQAAQGTAAKSEKVDNQFFGALRFTMLYTFATLPFVIVIGFLLALGVNGAAQRLKAVFISASLLPFIITPVVAALSIKWLFRDNGLVPYLLSHVGIQVFWMAQAWSARLLIIVYGIWHVVPFAFIVFYAGLQSVPQDALEAATIDGATRWQIFRLIELPVRALATRLWRPSACTALMLAVVFAVRALLPAGLWSGTVAVISVASGALSYALATWWLNRAELREGLMTFGLKI